MPFHKPCNQQVSDISSALTLQTIADQTAAKLFGFTDVFCHDFIVVEEE